MTSHSKCRVLLGIAALSAATMLTACSNDKNNGTNDAALDTQVSTAPSDEASSTPDATTSASAAAATPTPTPTATATTATVKPTPTVTATPTKTAAATKTPTATPTKTATKTPTPSPIATSGAPTSGTITISGFAYSTLTIARGGTITVFNKDGAGHTVTDAGGAFDQNAPGGSTTTFRAPSVAKTYSLVCNFHGSMSGSLIVK